MVDWLIKNKKINNDTLGTVCPQPWTHATGFYKKKFNLLLWNWKYFSDQDPTLHEVCLSSL